MNTYMTFRILYRLSKKRRKRHDMHAPKFWGLAISFVTPEVGAGFLHFVKLKSEVAERGTLRRILKGLRDLLRSHEFPQEFQPSCAAVHVEHSHSCRYFKDPKCLESPQTWSILKLKMLTCVFAEYIGIHARFLRSLLPTRHPSVELDRNVRIRSDFGFGKWCEHSPLRKRGSSRAPSTNTDRHSFFVQLKFEWHAVWCFFRFESCMVWRLWVGSLWTKWSLPRNEASVQSSQSKESKGRKSEQFPKSPNCDARCKVPSVMSHVKPSPAQPKRCADPGVLHQSSLQ